eukprot:TRINITY_DN63908_c0_g1_i1.p1 TRINITY_DN63908_c0_g1~~TRINITY_DN63908_c0_g1_i1.p1  ORF type:complete len:391 (+),score=112.90 TRINITY_DN63908_c0_g1_i1:122-1294(+)
MAEMTFSSGLAQTAGQTSMLTVGYRDADLDTLSHDMALTNKIMKKRQEELARRTKLLDPRKRTGGVPHDILDAQLLEKRAIAEKELGEHEYYARSALLQEQVAQSIETMKETAARDRQKAAIGYSMQNLRKEQRREYALSDPNQVRNDRVLTNDEIERLGPSSMLNFKGDCFDEAGRKRETHEQMRNWLQQQMQEKQDRKAAERAIDLKFDQEVGFANQVRGICEQAATDEAREDKRQEAADNLALAQEHGRRRQMRLDKEIEAKNRHVDSVMNSDRMKEATDYVIGATGRVCEFKRMSAEEVQDVFNTNAMQVLGSRSRKAAEQREEEEYAENVNRGVEVLAAIESEKKRMVLERRLQAEEHNKAMAERKRLADAQERRTYKSFTRDGD